MLAPLLRMHNHGHDTSGLRDLLARDRRGDLVYVREQKGLDPDRRNTNDCADPRRHLLEFQASILPNPYRLDFTLTAEERGRRLRA